MTDENNDFDPENPTESLSDVGDALESAGATPDGEETADENEESDSSGLPGPLSVVEGLSGTGKSLDAYSNSPIAEALGPEDSKGAKHIARGIDGLSPIGAAHPLVDIGIGVVLLQMEKADSEEAANSGDNAAEAANPADDPRHGSDGDLT